MQYLAEGGTAHTREPQQSIHLQDKVDKERIDWKTGTRMKNSTGRNMNAILGRGYMYYTTIHIVEGRRSQYRSWYTEEPVINLSSAETQDEEDKGKLETLLGRRGKDEYDSWPRNGTSRKWESIHLGGHRSGQSRHFGGEENETNCLKYTRFGQSCNCTDQEEVY